MLLQFLVEVCYYYYYYYYCIGYEGEKWWEIGKELNKYSNESNSSDAHVKLAENVLITESKIPFIKFEFVQTKTKRWGKKKVFLYLYQFNL
jgi:hypothetical protein